MKPGINKEVNTPNGKALLFQEWYNMADPDGEYIMVRHPKKVEIDLSLCAHQFSATNRDGWLVAYKAEEVTE